MNIKNRQSDIFSFSQLKKIIWMCCVFISLSFYAGAEEASKVEVTTIKINNAQQTSYKKADDTGNDIILLDGNVELTVEKGSTTSNIKADKITYDRKTEMLYAEGNVEITTSTSSSGGETTTARSLLLNTSTLEGIFDGGRVVQTQSDAINLPSGSTLIVFSDLFGKGSSNTIAFKNSSLTFCDDEDPHWHIDATRTWLLPGGEFAFFNALLYVGYVPVIYLPAFYYPKDELVFNPVFNYRKREGYSVQTTTYLYGRKPLDTTDKTTSSSSSSSSSDDKKENKESTSAEALKGLYNFVRPSVLKEQKLEGLVLHNLDEDYKGNTSQYVKILADWYTNLGAMVGVSSALQPSSDYVTNLVLDFDIGVSNTIFKSVDASGAIKYYPFSASGKKYPDSATFLSLKTPFRYSGNFEITVSKPVRVSLKLPIYSDPYYHYDFKTYRTETMDWISYFLENVNSSEDDKKEESVTEVSSFTWQLSSSGNPSLPSIFKPYINSVSYNLSSSVNISSLQTVTTNYSTSLSNKASLGNKEIEYNDKEWKTYTPTRKFYYPSLVTPINTTINISGTIFSWPLPEKSASTANKIEPPITLNKPDELKTPKELEAEKEAEKKAENDDKEVAQATDEKKDDDEEGLFEYYLPDLEYKPTMAELISGITYSLNYNLQATIVNQMAYSSVALEKSEDFDWNNVRSYMYTIKTPAKLTSNFNYGGNFLSVTNGINYSPIYQKHPYISNDVDKGGYSKSEANTLILADYNAEAQDIANTNNVTFKPFYYLKVVKDTSFSWNSSIKLYRRKFIGDLNYPQWEDIGPDLEDEECVTENSFTAVLSTKELNDKIGQSLTLTAVIPPLLRSYKAKFELTFPFVTASVETGINEKTKKEVPKEEKWKKNPLTQSLNITFPLLGKSMSFTESYSYDLEEERDDSFKLDYSWYGLSVHYLKSYTYGYDFDKGWKVRKEKEFLPYSLTFSYSPSTVTFYSWFNRIVFAPGVNTSLVADLIRPTNSYFLFTPSITFKITDFMNITFSSTTRNSVLYWYFHNESGDLYSETGSFPGNMIDDLVDSFRFDDQKKRESSGFKLKSLNMAVTHELHDWKFNMTVKVEPRLITENGKKTYNFDPYITIGVVWNPMESIKTSIIDEYGTWKLE